MKNKTFIICTIALLLAALVFVGAVNVIIDPLLQYHMPFFGLQPDIKNEVYQNPGVAKNFEYENVIIGNSYSENFLVSDVEDLFGGKTVKLTAAGTFPLYWSRLLNIIKEREAQPKNILINFETSAFMASTTELRHDIPEYLYDDNPFNDVSYIFNFSVLKDFTLPMIRNNLNGKIPDYNTVFMWDKEVDSGKDFVLSHYSRPEISKKESLTNDFVKNAVDNVEILIPYIESMKETEFVFYCSPFSILYWDDAVRSKNTDAFEESFYKAYSMLLQYNNVKIYFWNDSDMMDIICNLDNYTDYQHYSPDVSHEIVLRIKNNQGLLTKENYKEEIGKFFDFVRSYDYDSIFE